MASALTTRIGVQAVDAPPRDREAVASGLHRPPRVISSLYFKEGRVKVELGLGRGRRKADKRQALAERDTKLEIAKALGRQAKGKH